MGRAICGMERAATHHVTPNVLPVVEPDSAVLADVYRARTSRRLVLHYCPCRVVPCHVQQLTHLHLVLHLAHCNVLLYSPLALKGCQRVLVHRLGTEIRVRRHHYVVNVVG